MELYKQISDANRIKYGTEAEKILRIIINQYSDRTHFIYEILQNAEDAGATRIQFHLEKEKLVIKHDGRPFNEKDIEGVCGIANGTKEDGTRIGHFGIGFKSVYCYTEHPYIYSGEYHFVIQNQLFPKEVPGSQEIAYDETCMILPFDKGEVPSSIAYQEIRDALTKKITAESIIMLNQISDVRIKIDGYPEEIEINKAKYSLDKKAYADNVFGLSMNTTITNTRSKQTRTKDADYLFFTDANAEATAIIFRVEGKELKAIKNSKIYAFFPTAKEAHQNFYIHAPFDTTPARDNFKEGAEYGKHNIKLIKAVGELIWFAFQWMKNHQYLSVSGFNTVFPVYEYEADDVLYGIYQNSIDMIREEALLPTNVPGEFKKIQEICVPLWGIIVDTFDDNDLRALRRKRNISWLAKEFSTEAYRDVRAFLNQNFKLETLEWKDLVLNMNAFFLSQKQLSWMEALMSKIESYCIKRATYDSHYIDVSQIPFVRTVSQEQICARDEHGKLQVYLNNPDIAKYRIESTFIKNECIRSFYRRALEIPEYNIEQETIENILPKYESANVKFKTKDPITENIDDLKVIKDAIYTNTSILERIKDKYIVTDGKNWYRPEEMYLRSNDTRSGYALVKGIIRIKYLADTYFDGTLRSLKLDEDFFKKIGCNAGIRMMPASRDEYLRAIRKYCGAKAESDYRTNIFFKTYISKKLDWSFNYDLYVQLMFAMKYFNKKIGNMQFICVDEGQDLAVNEYRLLSELNQNHVVFNIFGDTNQLMKSGRGISDWNLLLSELQAEQYVLNENYRNTNQITRFCNDNFGLKTLQTGVDGPKVREISRRDLEKELAGLMITTERIAILLPRTVQKMKYLDMDILPENIRNMIGETMDNGFISVMYVDEVKGIEFDKVFVVSAAMHRNEKYIAYTRALSELIVVVDEKLMNNNSAKKVKENIEHNKKAGIHSAKMTGTLKWEKTKQPKAYTLEKTIDNDVITYHFTENTKSIIKNEFANTDSILPSSIASSPLTNIKKNIYAHCVYIENSICYNINCKENMGKKCNKEGNCDYYISLPVPPDEEELIAEDIDNAKKYLAKYS